MHGYVDFEGVAYNDLPKTKTKAKIERMRQYARAAGRDPEKLHFSVSPGIGAPLGLDEVKRYRDVGVHQVIVGTIPRDARAAHGDIERLAERIVAPAAKL